MLCLCVRPMLKHYWYWNQSCAYHRSTCCTLPGLGCSSKMNLRRRRRRRTRRRRWEEQFSHNQLV